MPLISLDEPGKEVLMMGNEAIARGALEAGVQVAAAYPGNPSSEIIGSLAGVAKEMGIYVEWSVNEKVALEVVAAAATSNVNALVAMKQNGLNVASDFLLNLNLTGIRGGLVMVVADDPSGISSTNEEDSRIYAKLADIPLLEPSTFQEAKEMTLQAFDLSRKIGNVVMIRSVTRISHARGNVVLGQLPRDLPTPRFDTSSPLSPMPSSLSHPALHRKLERAAEILKDSEFNHYEGPENPEILIITCGAGWFFSKEAIDILGLSSRLGVLKIGTTWPLPGTVLLNSLKTTEKVLFLEEVDPVLENNVAAFFAFHNRELPAIDFMGKNSGHVPSTGELSPDLVLQVLSGLTGVRIPDEEPDYVEKTKEALLNYAPNRSLAFCAGCPHRSSLWAIKKALALDGRDGILFGDIGCYSLGIFATGYFQLKTLHAMGSGAGMACGFGNFARLGATQPSLAVCGDSTFFHSVVPALMNSVHSGSNFLLIVLDNSATAMTGFQPHPGSPVNAMGMPAPSIVIEDLCRSIGMETVVRDPFDIEDTALTIYEMIQRQTGPKALVLRHECALVSAKKRKAQFRMRVDPEKCVGDDCGCNRLCTRVFKCPGLIWDRSGQKSKIDEAICAGCGVCVNICPSQAIVREDA
ncbi:MAG: 4Fe-4S binding protein [Desulfomonile tiedjei]|uniref:Indolepyruvate oxidoreductase subunit IorA n=1 Tax=Desulfomonile tiedjei TaxID=2358 RepID=A0A9D6UXR8_9BACT|nr:4Fe-4S binding protein [Desulfomonile tiedjei]